MTEKKSTFKRLLSFIGSAVSAVRTVISLIIILVFVGVVGSLFPNQPPYIADTGALFVVPQGTLVDQKTAVDPLAQVFNEGAGTTSETLVSDVVRAIDSAATDARISHLVMGLDQLSGAGISKLAEIGNALQRFKQSDKPIIAYADNYGQQQYFLAAHADKVFLNSLGSVTLFGYGAYNNYFKDALDKLKVNVHVFRAGTHKSAVEPFLDNSMSSASRKQTSELVRSLWDFYGQRVESLRELPEGSIDEYSNQLDTHLRDYQGDAAQLALGFGLVDQIATREEVNDYLNALVPDKNGQLEHIDLYGYLQHINGELKKGGPNAHKIAVVTAVGNMIDGYQPAGNTGGETLAEILKGVKDEEGMAAVVLRIDSPGGSVYAAEVIRDAITSIRAKQIPVVVSMGSYAASGGYWIAAEADHLVAMPTTLTGSIGVYSVIPTFERSLSALGIYSDGVDSTSMSSIMQLDRPMTQQAENIFQLSVDNIYQRFVKLVSTGRNLPQDRVATLAEGRVYSGVKALELGLIDQLGDLEDAIKVAAELAEVDDYSIDYRQIPMTFLEQAVSQLDVRVHSLMQANMAPDWIPKSLLQTFQDTIQPLRWVDQFNDPRKIYLHCSECPM